ncbi:hypothetical protein CVT24_011887 [Panaeolus cyanescens]|uniref:VOC domain-containing protein n=1 Tax=Panaeolus cyanescens TaxID=181874 RepID=A0A409YNP6_9AGAR|nr:hypothetical protein CVT24_011887 [Panaeolus cyanescens]
MPLDHINVNVSDLEESLKFYKAALKPLGYKVKMSFSDDQVVGFGDGWMPACDFWVVGPNAPSADGSEVRNPPPPNGPPRKLTGSMHIAFTAKNRRTVREFYKAAIAAGAKCNGPPGLRPEYFSLYYGAFVLDPDGRNIEAVCTRPGFVAEEWGAFGWIIFGALLGCNSIHLTKMSLNHISINVTNMEESLVFYKAALKPLGYKVKMSFVDGQVVGMGSGWMPGADFWLSGPGTPSADGSEVRNPPPADAPARTPTGAMHIAFTAKNRRTVREFYKAAIAAGAKCNGPPGLRPEYFCLYYGAFVLDPDGRNIEAVCMRSATLSEEWGIVGWSVFTLLVGAVSGGIAKFYGFL